MLVLAVDDSATYVRGKTVTTSVILSVANANAIPLKSKSIHCVVTSPPYWGLRKYAGDQGAEWPAVVYAPMAGVGEIVVPAMRYDLGLEPTPEAFVAHIVSIFRDVWRVLRDDGVLFLNFGDSYNGSGKGRNADGHHSQGTHWKQSTNRGAVAGIINTMKDAPGLKRKDLVGIPWRIAFALQADGWYLRSDIIWHKTAPMPESVTDRCTSAHEYLFMLAKSERYFYDAEAVKEDAVTAPRDRLRPNGKATYEKFGFDTGCGVSPSGKRNRRDVWTINQSHYKGSHFATFPPPLVEPCLLAGTSEHGVCPKCGNPWGRVVERKLVNTEGWGVAAKDHHLTPDAIARNGKGGAGDNVVDTIGWRPACEHYPRVSEWPKDAKRKKGEDDAAYEARSAAVLAKKAELIALWDSLNDCVPAKVLDPFCGSGTTGEVSRIHGRDFVGLDMSHSYLADLATERIYSAQRQIKMGL